MNNEKVHVSAVFKVFVEGEGVWIEVGPDGDGLDLIEVRTVDENSKLYFGDFRIPLSVPMAKGLCKALGLMLNQMGNEK